MDFKADRIMDYAVYSLPPGAREYKRIMEIPISELQEDGTSCSSWIVRYVIR